jgi:hypothetical protein
MLIKTINNDELIKIEIQKENNVRKKYEILYDCLYDYLKKEWNEKNYCNFIDNKCVANRKGISVHDSNGCCYKKGTGLCIHLKNKNCSCESISCKFYTCSYLRRHGVHFNPKKIRLVNNLLNRKQKKILVRSLFAPKNDVIDLLVKYESKIKI